MRYLAVVCLFLLLASCAPRANPWVKVVEVEEMTWIVQKIQNKYQHEEGKRLRLEHSACYYTNKITGLRLEFSSQEILEVKQARELMVDLVEDFLREINQDPVIGEQLASYPFTAENMTVEVNFESWLGQYVDPYYVGCMSLRGGMCYYYAFDMKDGDSYRWHSRVEPYYKSREFVTLDRAAAKQYAEEHPRMRTHVLDELFLPSRTDEKFWKKIDSQTIIGD